MKELINKLFTLTPDELNKVNEYITQLKNPKKKRSLNANSYCWVLLQKIADVINSTKEEVYRKYIKEKGIFRAITINNEAVSTFAHIWEQKGYGWVVEILNKGRVTTDLLAYYGTSSYNTKQMANFVDYVVEEAKGLDIETLTPREIASLKENWK